MQTYAIGYKFNQRLMVPAQEAFHWSTDYRPDDLALMGEKGKRRIKRVTKDTIILEELVAKEHKQVRKLKLIKINPKTLSWHNIQLEGPNKYSEFIYEISPEGKQRSKLTFTGLLVVYAKSHMSRQRLRHIARTERDGDSRTWKLLASAMAKER